MKLNEASVTDDIVCPKCNFVAAMETYDSHGFFPEDYENYKFDIRRECPLCSWTEYESEDLDGWEEAGEEIHWPPNPLEYEPSDKNLKIANKVQKIIKKADKSIDRAIYDFIMMEWPGYDLKTRDYNSFLRGNIKYIFNEEGDF